MLILKKKEDYIYHSSRGNFATGTSLTTKGI